MQIKENYSIILSGEKMKKVLFTLIQLSWGIVQSFIGFFLFLVYIRFPHSLYNGAVVTRWSRGGGVSLGLFVFAEKCDKEREKQLISHEYGHCVQSLILGPLYLLVIGLPSVTWATIFSRRRKKGVQENYYKFYTEKWAERIAGRKILNDLT